MILDLPASWNRLLVIGDAGFKYDRDLAEAEGGTPVYRKYSFGRAVLGSQWARTARGVLYPYGADTEALTPEQELSLAPMYCARPAQRRRKLIAEKRAGVRDAMAAKIKELAPALTVVLATRATEIKTKEEDEADLKNHSGTASWRIFDAPDSHSEMAGTVYQSHLGPVMALLNPANHEFVFGAQIRNSLIGAHAFAQGRMGLLEVPIPTSTYMPAPLMSLLLRRMLDHHRAGHILSVDLETVPSEDIITCIGLACGPYAVSVPWDPFPIAGRREFEPAGSPGLHRLVKELLAVNAAKVGHNILGFDVPYLAGRGFTMNGPVEDTMVAAGVVYKQYRKGLQACVAREFLVQPWKSEHAAPGYHKSSKEAWTADPIRLRSYNMKDAYFTLKLWEVLCRKAGL